MTSLEGGGRDDAGDEAHGEGFGRGDHAGGVDQVGGVGEADDARQQPRDAVLGDEAAAGEGGGELCGVGWRSGCRSRA